MFCDWCKHKMMPSENWHGVELDGKEFHPLCSNCYSLIMLVRYVERKRDYLNAEEAERRGG